MQRAVIDELYRAVVFDEPEVWKRLEERSEECAFLRSMVCTDHSGGIETDLNLGGGSNKCIIPIFLGPKAFFISGMTAAQGVLQNGRSCVTLDYSLSFDSNFAEKLKLLVNRTTAGENSELLDVESVLMLKAHNERVQFDLLPFLYENVRLSRANSSNTRPVDTLVAFRVLDYVDWQEFRSSRVLRVDGMTLEALKAKLRPAAEELIGKLQHSEDFIRHEATALATEALLLRLAALWKVPNRDIKKIFGQLLDFCIVELGFTPLTDLSLIWSAISPKQTAAFLGPILGCPSTMLEKVSGMAWDIAHLRLLERLATQRAHGDFYVPFFVSLDARWRDLLRQNPIRFMLFDDRSRTMRSGRVDEASFLQICHFSASEDAKRLLSVEQSAERKAYASALRIEIMQELVAKERRRWA
ncbi:hypothetical protein [Pseudomonas kurunegalensis]|uniref:hypothetical protein n=1 Tax=Pseudomonas kurunegalensis TaxID=485880 RepID=UPI0025705673|nr:hypothetical protein [Pseudomonas kurunegalensis]WJD61547.1 hypothetical protein QQ992_21810 [Pseudomonas kurunegalensis]